MRLDVVQYALNQQNRRFRSKRRLSRFLLEKGYEIQEAEDAILQLEQWGYLDDLKLAMSIVHRLTVRQAKGKLYIHQKLLEEEIDISHIEEALSTYSDHEEKQLAETLAKRYLQLNDQKWADADRKWASLLGYLSRRGFSESVIEEISAEFSSLDDGYLNSNY